MQIIPVLMFICFEMHYYKKGQLEGEHLLQLVTTGSLFIYFLKFWQLLFHDLLQIHAALLQVVCGLLSNYK